MTSLTRNCTSGGSKGYFVVNRIRSVNVSPVNKESLGAEKVTYNSLAFFLPVVPVLSFGMFKIYPSLFNDHRLISAAARLLNCSQKVKVGVKEVNIHLHKLKELLFVFQNVWKF